MPLKHTRKEKVLRKICVGLWTVAKWVKSRHLKLILRKELTKNQIEKTPVGETGDADEG
jgi:hypothetical protein